jgi:hypothetical protein
MWKPFLVALIGLSLAIYLYKNKKWTHGTWVACFSLIIFFSGTVQIPQVSATIENSFNLFKRIDEIEKELKHLALETADIKKLHVLGDIQIDGTLFSSSKKGEPGSMTLYNKDGLDSWKVTIIDDDLVFQRLDKNEWITRYSIPHKTDKN